jgi:hypothetical protein
MLKDFYPARRELSKPFPEFLQDLKLKYRNCRFFFLTIIKNHVLWAELIDSLSEKRRNKEKHNQVD